MLMEIGGRFSFSTEMADSMPRHLVVFNGIQQEQGSWQYCVDFNRRQMPSLTPVNHKDFTNSQSPDVFRFTQSWKALNAIQRYTEGEAFFLCYPAAFQFGIFAQTGEFDESLFPNWKKSYLSDQQLTLSGGEKDGALYESSKFNLRIRSKYSIEDATAANAAELTARVKNKRTSNLHVIQVSCNYPMFGNKRFGHFLGVTHVEAETAIITGCLAPFGIYDTPFARVQLNQLGAFAEISNWLLASSNRTAVDLQDRPANPGIHLMRVGEKKL